MDPKDCPESDDIDPADCAGGAIAGVFWGWLALCLLAGFLMLCVRGF